MEDLVENYIQKGIQFVATGRVSKEFEEYARLLNERYPKSVKISFGYSGHLAKKLYASCDFLLNISSIEPCGLCPLIANKYGTLPICYYTGGIKDNVSDFKNPDGNGYILRNYDATSICDLLDRTLHDYQNKEKMKAYIISGMHKNFDIRDCAQKYLDLYEKM